MLGKPWQFDREVVYDGKDNTVTFEKYGIRHIFNHLKDGKTKEKKVLLVGGKEFLHQLKDIEVSFVVIGKLNIVLIHTIVEDLQHFLDIQTTYVLTGYI
jgi:hypothetical protein